MRVLKFGGTSLADRERIREVSRLVHSAAEDTRVVVVASAMAGVTDGLQALVDASTAAIGSTAGVGALAARHLEVLDGLPEAVSAVAGHHIEKIIAALRTDLEALAAGTPARAEIADRVLAVGERLSVQLVAASLHAAGCPVRVVDAAELVVTDSAFGEAEVDFDTTLRRCRRCLGGRNTAVAVVTGFIGADACGRTTTLGRGGSDYSAALLGAALEAERVEIWTDVNGVLSAPPRLVPSVSSLPWLSYEEAAELSFFGAKVLHPRTVRPLAERGIPIHVRNTLAPDREGTEIAARPAAQSRVAAVSAFEEVTVLRIGQYGANDLRDALMVCRSSSDGATLVAVPTDRAEVLIAGVSCEHRGVGSIVALVGHDIALHPWAVGRAMASLAGRGIVVRGFAAGSGPHTVTLLVDRTDLESALCTIQDVLMHDREFPGVGREELRPETGGEEHVTAA